MCLTMGSILLYVRKVLRVLKASMSFALIPQPSGISPTMHGFPKQYLVINMFMSQHQAHRYI